MDAPCRPALGEAGAHLLDPKEGLTCTASLFELPLIVSDVVEDVGLTECHDMPIFGTFGALLLGRFQLGEQAFECSDRLFMLFIAAKSEPLNVVFFEILCRSKGRDKEPQREPK